MDFTKSEIREARIAAHSILVRQEMAAEKELIEAYPGCHELLRKYKDQCEKVRNSSTLNEYLMGYSIGYHNGIADAKTKICKTT